VAEVVVLESHELASDRDAWDVVAATQQIVNTPRGRALRLGGGEPVEPVVLTRSGSWRLDRFDQLRLIGTANDKTRVQLAFRRKGRLLGSSLPVPMAHGASAGVTIVDLPVALSQRGLADTLVIVFDGMPRSVSLNRVELVSRPPSALVPDPELAPTLFFLGSEARRGLGLIAERPLEVELSVPAGGVLRFALGLPAAAEPDYELVLRCVGESAGAVIEQRVHPHRTRVTDAEPDSAWRNVLVDLGALAGQRASLRFELEAAAIRSNRLALVVAEPQLEQRPTPTAGQQRQLVLLVTSDTHRGDHMGLASAGPEVSTPQLDALAGRGVFFESCFTSTNFTNPSHVALMTGEHPRDTGIVDNAHALLFTAETLAEVFGAAGWATWAVTSAGHLRPAVSGLGQGFERFARTSQVEQRAGEAVDQALAWLDEGGSRPVFLWLHLFDAHMPYEVPAPFDRLGYDGPDDPFEASLPDPGLERELPGNLAGLRVLEFGRTQYAAQVTYLDHELGRLLNRPEVLNGTVALVGDHGEVLGAHDIWFDHAELYTDTLHVPLVLAWPDAPAGSRRAEPVSHLDLGRTLLDLAGLERSGFPGRSLITEQRPGPLFALASHRTSASITHDGAHLIFHLISHNRRYEAHQVELFDLTNDSGCEHDLVDEQVELAGGLRERLIEWLEARRELGWSAEQTTDTETLQQLRELGYVEAPQAESGAALYSPDDCAWCVRWR
jgi:arylsulfatase A-like enzyme